MALASDIGAYLVATTSLGLNYGSSSTMGNLFLGRFPEFAPDAAVAIIPYPGAPAVRAHASSTTPAPVHDSPRFQVVVRDKLENYSTVEALASSIHAVLDYPGTITLSGTRYLKLEALSTPYPMPVADDDNGRQRFQFNVEAWKER